MRITYPYFGERVKVDARESIRKLKESRDEALAGMSAASTGASAAGAAGVSSAAVAAGSGLEIAGLAQISSGPEATIPDSAHNSMAELDSVGGDHVANWSEDHHSSGGAAMSTAGHYLKKAGKAKTKLKAPSRN